MAADPRAATVTPTDADVAAWTAVRDLAGRFGPDRAAASSTYGQGGVPEAYTAAWAARGAGIDDVLRILHLEPGQLAAIAGVSLPAPASPLPSDEATVFPDDDDDDDAVWAAGPYLTRQRLTLLRDVPEPTAAALAVCVPGVRGLVLFMAARGDAVAEVAATLGISVDAVDAMLRDRDGTHLTRPDG